MHNQGRAGTPSKPFFCLQPELRARSPLAGPRSPDARAGRGHGQVASAGRAQGKLTPGGSVSLGAPPARAQLGAGGGAGGAGEGGAAEASADEESLGLRSPPQASRGLVLTLPAEMRLPGLSRPTDSWSQAGCLRTKDDSPGSVQPCLSPEEAAGAREGARAPASRPLTPQRA